MKIRSSVMPKARIEMIPLIDSFFLVLVYFIYAFLAMSVHRGVPLDLPSARTAVEQKKEHHGISITKTDEIYFNQVITSLVDLRAILARLRSKPNEEDIQIYIYGDKAAKHGTVMAVLDLIRELEFKKVSIETGHGES